MSELNIPGSWAEVDLEHLVYLRARIGWKGLKASEYTTEGPLFLSVREINDDGTLTLTKVNHISHERFEESPEIMLKDGDVIISKDGTIGKVAYVENLQEKATVNSSMAVLTPHDGFRYKFLFHYLKAPSFQSLVKQKIQGAAIPHIFQKDLRKLIVPIPPEKEQERIVQKIKSCFSKIEETEQNLSKVEVLLEKYRESLLAKAFRGELIPQNPDDEPASILLAKIREDRAQNQKGKKKEQEFSPISDDEKPFDIPESWEWVRLGEFEVVTGNTPKQIPNTKNDIPFFKPADFSYDGELYVDKSQDSSSSTYTFRGVSKNSVVLVCIGATLGKSGIVTKDGAFNQQSNALLPNNNLSPEFLCLWLRSKNFQNNLWRINSSTTMPIVNKSQLERLVFPLCPLKEQRDISKHLIQKLNFINDITKQIKLKRVMLARTKESILSKAFEGQLVEQIESEGTGHDLLQKILAQKNQMEVVKESTKKKVARKASKKNN